MRALYALLMDHPTAKITIGIFYGMFSLHDQHAMSGLGDKGKKHHRLEADHPTFLPSISSMRLVSTDETRGLLIMSGPGEALLVARKAQGLTQDDVCGQFGITQATLSRYENDQRVPDDETLARFAQIYGVTAGFLRHGKRMQGALAIDSHMRRQETAKSTIWRRLEARLNMYRLHVSLLFEEVSLRSTNIIPTFDPEETQPAAAALITRAQCAQWKMPIGPVLRLIRWLEAAGCIVIEEDFGTTSVDGLSQWIGDHPVILVNSGLLADRKRLTLAHEFGPPLPA